jgi:hypothetical protein
MRNLVILGALGILLAGCVQEIKYSSSETIFRGTWNGTASQSDHVMAVRLNLTSEYVDISTYTVVGTITLGTDAPLELNGKDRGSGVKITIQSPPPELMFEGSISDATTPMGSLSCSALAGSNKRRCSLNYSSGVRSGQIWILEMHAQK